MDALAPPPAKVNAELGARCRALPPAAQVLPHPAGCAPIFRHRPICSLVECGGGTALLHPTPREYFHSRSRPPAPCSTLKRSDRRVPSYGGRALAFLNLRTSTIMVLDALKYGVGEGAPTSVRSFTDRSSMDAMSCELRAAAAKVFDHCPRFRYPGHRSNTRVTEKYSPSIRKRVV